MNKSVDVLIIGSGVSGIYCALNLNRNFNVLLVCKDKITCTNTYLAQGGISVAKSENDIELFVNDTLKAGRYKNNKEAVQILAEESQENIKQLISFGINFDKDENNNLDFTREGAHSVNRIVHTKDNTGQSVAETLINEVRKRKNILVYEDTYFGDIIEKSEKCVGAVLFKDNKEVHIYAKYVVIATGGIGGLYENSTNQRILTGDGLAVALRHNVKTKDLNYIQIHPTAFYEETSNRRLLISESVRGEGGILLNVYGHRFVDELLPRDIVSKAIYDEMEKTNSSYVYLDVRFLEPEYIKKRFMSIYSECLERGCDITKDLIKVAPVQHFFMGGIEVNVFGQTSMEGLLSVGEAACTGVHGANRLASNSLLEGLVFSKRAAEFINKNINKNEQYYFNIEDNTNNTLEEIKQENLKIVRNAIQSYGGRIDHELLYCR